MPQPEVLDIVRSMSARCLVCVWLLCVCLPDGDAWPQGSPPLASWLRPGLLISTLLQVMTPPAFRQ
ncbi:hypothetical protein SAMN04487976_106181 [Xaviernesmea oryzae]|nr:hypothetical protein SAMN04487976_106181 [Xaviernesmea oryzae]